MTLRRMLDDPNDDFESLLLGSARIDGPSDRQVLRGVAAIAAGSAALAKGGVGFAATTAAGAPATSGHATAMTVGILKWLGVGLATGALATGTATFVVQKIEAPRKPASEIPRGTAPANRVVASSPVAASHVEAPPAVTAERMQPPSESGSGAAAFVARRAAGAGAAAGPSRDVVPGIGAELDALARARLALSARSPERVLAELETYRGLVRTHVLDAEATMLRLEALVQAGNTGGAADLAGRYLSEHPDSPHRARLEEIVHLGGR